MTPRADPTPLPGRLHREQSLVRQAVRALAPVAVVGPIAYIVLVTVLGLAWAGYDPVRQTQSELGAVDAPHGPAMNLVGFLGLGLTILAFGVVHGVLLRPSPWRRLATALLVVAGLGMIAVAFAPCDARCVDVTPTGALHSTLSMPAAIGLPAAAMLSAGAFAVDGRFDRMAQVVTFVVGALAMGAGPVVAAELLPGYDGLLQRGAMWALCAWMAAVALRLTRLDRAAHAAG